ncbi:MAG: carbohydrate ABC transporter permease [Chloroflexi bacterium]|nr:carbohydrate ABC transporter permease [Chloroflexota bacterium]
MLVPLYWLIASSLKERGQVFVVPPIWIPDPIVWENYPRAFSVLPFGMFLRNSLTIVVLNLIGVLLTSSMAAFGFSRMRFPLRNLWFALIISTMMLPGVVTLIPTFIVFKSLNWVNTFLPLIVPTFFGGGAFNIFLFRQFFLTIPYEMDEAARIDGASSFRVYWQIILPLSGPVLASVGIFNVVWNWNDFLHPLIYLHGEERLTVAVGLRLFQGMYWQDWSLMMAASTVMLLPMLVLFFVAQRYFVQGVTVTGFGGR